MHDSLLIKGGKPLRGEVELSGAKNIALKVLIAALLFENKVVVNHIPRIADIIELTHLLEKLGVGIVFNENTIEIDPTTLKSNTVDLLHASRIRTAFI